jgi:hypothetical protein
VWAEHERIADLLGASAGAGAEGAARAPRAR